MIKIESVLNVIDNSGATRVKCLKILGKSYKCSANIGDILVVVVYRLKKKKKIKKVKMKEILYALVVSQKKNIKRNKGLFYLNLKKSGVILLNKSKGPLANRIFEPVYKELKFKGYIRLFSMCKYII